MDFLYAVRKGFVRQTTESLPYEMENNYFEIKYVEKYPVPTLCFCENGQKVNSADFELILLQKDTQRNVTFDEIVSRYTAFLNNEIDADMKNSTETTRTIIYYSGSGIKTIFKNADTKSYKFENLYQAKLFDDLYDLANRNNVIRVENLRKLKDLFYLKGNVKTPNNDLFNFIADKLRTLLEDYQGKDADVYKNAISILKQELALYGEYLKNKDYIEKTVDGAFWCFEIKRDKTYNDLDRLQSELKGVSFVRDDKINSRIDLSNPYVRDYYMKKFEEFYKYFNLRLLNKTTLTELEMNNLRKVMLDNTQNVFNTKIFIY